MKTLPTLLLSLFAAGVALADGDRMRVPLLPKYQQECSACHIAYPPGLLPATSWQRLMGDLPRHFGSDASLDAATVSELNRWLVLNARKSSVGQRTRELPPEGRITRSAWFVSEHDEISAATWKRATIKSASNCIACHGGAEQGNFNEHAVRIPR